MEDNSVSKQFSKTIAKVAALLGHTRRGNSVVKCYGDTFSVIFFQRDKYSTSSRVDFWCNVGGGSKLLHEHFQSIREPFQMVFDQCPFRIMSDLYCHPGRWTLTSATNTEETALSVVDCLNSMDWFLKGFESDQAIKRILLEQDYHIVPDKFRDGYLRVYAREAV